MITVANVMIPLKKIVKSFFYTFYSLLRVAKDFKLNPSNLNSINVIQNSICVLGNGPSLNGSLKDHRSFLSDKDVMCVNSFVVSNEFSLIKPKYYVILDPVFFIDDVNEKLIRMRSNIFQQLNKKTTWKIYLFIPIKFKRFFNINIINNVNIKIIYFRTTPISGFDLISHSLYRCNLGMPRAQNVLVAAIYISVNLMYENIFLFGADHSWLNDIIVNDDNVVCIRENHFYDNDVDKYVPLEKGNKKGDIFKMHEILGAFSLMFEGYFDLQRYADREKVMIYNASSKTYIDSFERVDVKSPQSPDRTEMQQ